MITLCVVAALLVLMLFGIALVHGGNASSERRPVTNSWDRSIPPWGDPGEQDDAA